MIFEAFKDQTRYPYFKFWVLVLWWKRVYFCTLSRSSYPFSSHYNIFNSYPHSGTTEAIGRSCYNHRFLAEWKPWSYWASWNRMFLLVYVCLVHWVCAERCALNNSIFWCKPYWHNWRNNMIPCIKICMSFICIITCWLWLYNYLPYNLRKKILSMCLM